MGNSASQPRRTDPNVRSTASPARRGRTPSPVSGPHSSMRTKRKSLELPDLNRVLAMTSGTEDASSSGAGEYAADATPPKSQAINIPKPAPDAPPIRRPNNHFSSSELIVPATHLPFPPNQAHKRVTSSTYAGPGGLRDHRFRAGRPRRMSQVYEEDLTPPHHEFLDPQEPPTPPSPSSSSFTREIINSTIPIGLFSDANANVLGDGEEGEETPVLPQGFDIDDSTLIEPTPVQITWQGGGKVVVLARAGDEDWSGRQPMDQDLNSWTTTVYLLPGTHHFRFLVDDQWRVSDELPTAVDDSGSLANYVSVQLGSPSTAATSLPPNLQPYSPTQARQPAPGQSFWSNPSSVEDDDINKIHSQISSAKWTSILPPALIEAAREEDSYLQASAGHYDPQSRSTRVSGFVPAPNVPPAPGMPRHLDKLILNTKMTVPGSTSNNGNSGGGSGQGSPSRVGRGENRDSRPRRERKREGRREEKREREPRRDRDQREQQQPRQTLKTDTDDPLGRSLANFPPAPPPSEDGTDVGLDGKSERSPMRAIAAEVEGGRDSGNIAAITAPESILKATPTTATTITTTTATPAPAVSITIAVPPTGPDSLLPPALGPSGLGTGVISGSRAITLDMENMPALTDDNSVLPVPSHVVIQHLCTSAIKNGVLAVASTTRYRKKYMTTVYYKPTS